MLRSTPKLIALASLMLLSAAPAVLAQDDGLYDAPG